MKQVSVVGVHQDGTGLRQSPCDAAENSGFGRVGVNDVWMKSLDFLDECVEGLHVLCWLNTPTKARDSRRRDISCLCFQEVGLIVAAEASEEALVKVRFGKAPHQAGDLNCRAAYIHSGDDSHHLDSRHGLSLPGGEALVAVQGVKVMTILAYSSLGGIGEGLGYRRCWLYWHELGSSAV